MRNVMISGGAGGIGIELVKIFVGNQYHVYMIDIDEKNAKNVVNIVGEENCTFIKLDVTDISAIKRICEKFDSSFTLKHIITLAGRALDSEWTNFENQSLENIGESVKLNLLGHINVIRAFLPYLREEKDDKSILMLSSINAIGSFGLPTYSAAKAGLYGFANALTKELGELSIRINTLSPGTVVTEATQKEPKNFDTLLQGTALGRFATPQDVAEVAYQMCTSFVNMTGQNVVLDAGQSKIHNY